MSDLEMFFDVEEQQAQVSVVDVIPAIEETVVVRQRSAAVTHLVQAADAEWEWQQLRDYVVNEIENRFGPFPRFSPVKESGIFKSFIKRWPNAVAIARFAFEHSEGMWRGAPINIQRFCKGNDPYFAAVISERIAAAAL